VLIQLGVVDRCTPQKLEQYIYQQIPKIEAESEYFHHRAPIN